jgi:hypothetical protein
VLGVVERQNADGALSSPVFILAHFERRQIMSTYEESKNKRRYARNITVYPDQIVVFNFSNRDGLFMKRYKPTLATKERIARLVSGQKANVVTSQTKTHELLFAFEFGESQS